MTRLRVKYDFEKYEDENSEKLVEGFSENKPHETLINDRKPPIVYEP